MLWDLQCQAARSSLSGLPSDLRIDIKVSRTSLVFLGNGVQLALDLGVKGNSSPAMLWEGALSKLGGDSVTPNEMTTKND